MTERRVTVLPADVAAAVERWEARGYLLRSTRSNPAHVCDCEFTCVCVTEERPATTTLVLVEP